LLCGGLGDEETEDGAAHIEEFCCSSGQILL
jgi:hypothetical protein